MEIFRQDKFELTRSDYRIISAYVLAMWLWLAYRFYNEGFGLADGAVFIALNTLETLGGFFCLKLLLDYILLRPQKWLLAIPGTLLIFIAAGGVTSILEDWWTGGVFAETVRPLSSFIIRSFNNSLIDLALLMGFIFSRKSYDQFINNKNLAIENRENALKILRSQFSPHFLFNNLNTIDALIDDRPAVAKQYVSHLASLYRYLTDTINQDVMPLDQELDFIRDYLFLIKVRFGDDYRFEIRVEQPTERRFLPSGTLQTAVENVVKHNAVDGEQIVTTLLVANEVVSISNNKGAQAIGQVSGTGLANLATRYDFLGTTALTIEDLPDHYTIRLPLLLAQPE